MDLLLDIFIIIESPDGIITAGPKQNIMQRLRLRLRSHPFDRIIIDSLLSHPVSLLLLSRVPSLLNEETNVTM